MGGMAVNAWWNDYIGVPFRDGGYGRSGADCWGLVRLVYRERFGIALPVIAKGAVILFRLRDR